MWGNVPHGQGSRIILKGSATEMIDYHKNQFNAFTGALIRVSAPNYVPTPPVPTFKNNQKVNEENFVQSSSPCRKQDLNNWPVGVFLSPFT